jgi:FixJ family two-component response regulator
VFFAVRIRPIAKRGAARLMLIMRMEGQSRPAPTERSIPMTQSHVHIMVVDDERNIRNNLRMLLEAEGYKVDTANSGDEALARVKEGGRYDIAFVDIQMPKMNGLELLRFLRGLRSKMPVVMLTAYGTVSRAVEAMKLGAVDFLEKPFDPKAIQLLCQEILKREKIGLNCTVDDLLHLADLARERKAYVEARVYLKTAILREVARPEPYYRLGEVSEAEGDKRRALQYYALALDANADYNAAREAFNRLKQTEASTHT